MIRKESYLSKLRGKRTQNEIYESELSGIGNQTEQTSLDSITRDRLTQARLRGKDVFEKLAWYKNHGVTGLEANRIDPESFEGPIKVFDCSNGETYEGGIRSMRRFKHSNKKERQTAYGVESDYKGLRETNSELLTETKESFSASPEKKFSDAMELIFTDLAHEIFGEGFEVCVPSEFDDIQNATDLILVQRNKKGEIINIFTIDFFAGTNPQNEGDFVRNKLHKRLTRLASGFNKDLNYVETKNPDGTISRLSARNVPGFVLPIDSKNLKDIAEAYWNSLSGNNNVSAEDRKKYFSYLRNTVFESISKQIKIQKLLTSKIKQKEYRLFNYRRSGGATIWGKKKEKSFFDIKSDILSSLDRCADNIPNPTKPYPKLQDRTQKFADSFLDETEKSGTLPTESPAITS